MKGTKYKGQFIAKTDIGLVRETNIKNRNTRQLVRKINEYVSFLKENKEFNTEFISIGDGIGISKRV